MSLSVNDGTGSQTLSGDDGTGSQKPSRSGTQRLSRSGTMSLEKEASALLNLRLSWLSFSLKSGARRGLTHAVRRISRSLTPSPQSIEDGVKKLERRPSKARRQVSEAFRGPVEASRNLTPPGPVLLGSAADKKPEDGDEEWDPYEDTESNVGGSSMNLGVPRMKIFSFTLWQGASGGRR